MDRARHGLGGHRRSHRGRCLGLHRLLVLRLLRGLRHGCRRCRLLVLRLWRKLLRHRRRGCRGLGLRVLRLLALLVLRGGLLAHRSAVLRLGHGRKLARECRPCPAGCRYARLLRIQRQVELQARLATTVLLILAGIESGAQFLKKRPADFKIALKVRLIGGSFAVVDPKRGAIRTVGRLLLLWLVRVHESTGRG